MTNAPDPKQTAIQTQLEDLKRRKIELLEAQRVYRKSHQLEFFHPHPGQQPFFDALLDPTKRQFIFLGGNRSGKTTSAVAAGCSMVEGRFPWVPKPAKLPPPFRIDITPTGEVKVTEADGTVAIHPSNKAYELYRQRRETDPAKLRFTGPLKIRICGEDYEKAIGQVIVPKLEQFLRPELIASKRKNQAGVYNQWILNDGTTIDLLTYAQDSAMMEGWSGHIVIYDEPPPRSIYIANQRGLIDYNGITIFSMTPLKEPWIANELVNRVNPSTFVHTVTTRENPHIDAKAIDSFEAQLSEDEKATRIGGQFLHLQGLVFKEFKRSTHAIKRFDIPKNWTVYVAIDTHPRTQQALLFLAVDPKERFYAVHEVFQHGTPDNVADWIIDFHDKIHPVHQAIIEPGSQGDQNRGDTTFQIIDRKLAQSGIPLDLGSKDLAGGILITREALMSANQQPSLFVFDDLARLLFEFSTYVWADWAKSAEKNEKQKPRDQDDHLIECLRRILQFPAQFHDPQQRSNLLAQANSSWKPSNRSAGY